MKAFSKTVIASLIVAATCNMAAAENILVVMSDQDHLNLKGSDVYQTGFYLNELMQPVKMFIDAGQAKGRKIAPVPIPFTFNGGALVCIFNGFSTL